MDETQRAYYEMKFRFECVQTGDAFQDFFASLMELRYPVGDFVRVRPWGPLGDRKNDGYLRSRRHLFQCFGPEDMRPLSKCVAKIDEDFNEALPYWKKHFDRWIFVHNDRKGLPADVLNRLLEISARHAPLEAVSWGPPALLEEFKLLKPGDVVTLLGPAPGRREVVEVRVEDVRRLLEHISLQAEQLPVDVRPVPASKLQHNQLSTAVATLLRAGMSRAETVKKYLRGLADQTRHDRVAAAFNAHYCQLKAEGLIPDEIFAGLQRFVSGSQVATPTNQAATLAILAFFFESCEIFERPPSEEAPPS